MLLHLIFWSLCFFCGFFFFLGSLCGALPGEKSLLLTLQWSGSQGFIFHIMSQPAFPSPWSKSLYSDIFSDERCPFSFTSILSTGRLRGPCSTGERAIKKSLVSPSWVQECIVYITSPPVAAACFLHAGNWWRGWFSAAPVRGGHFTNKPSVITSVQPDRPATCFSDAVWH